MSFVDFLFVFYFSLAAFLALVFDSETILINPQTYTNASSPLWPPAEVIKEVHSWGREYDPLVLNRPIWFKTAVVLELVFQVPFYFIAIYAFVMKRNWIRMPSIVFGVYSLTIMILIFAEQTFGPDELKHPWITFSVYAPFAVAPAALLYRVRDPVVFDKAMTMEKAKAY